jgi:dihydrofolate synthase/folylpolyglutamate synthase
MNYQEAIDYIHSASWLGMKLGLERIRELLSLMYNPQDELRIIHVAGTNGKGSTCEMLSRTFEESGFKTGLFISPFIRKFNERMQINHHLISDEELASTATYVKKFTDIMECQPSEFEIVTAIAFEYFYRNKCDYVIMEVGLGGRLDATNIIKKPILSVITTIDYDHMQQLGNSLSEIAAEKAGIIKGADVVSYHQDKEVIEVLERISREKGSKLIIADFNEIRYFGHDDKFQFFSYKNETEYALSLMGEHQLKNASGVLESVEALKNSGIHIPEEAVKSAFKKSFWPGRFEIISKDPLFIVDGSHNPQGAKAMVDAVKRYYPERQTVTMIGISSNKDIEKIIEIFDEITKCYVSIEADTYRAIDKEELAVILRKTGKPVYVADTIVDGIEKSISLAEDEEIAISVGSLFTVAEVREYFCRY